MKFSSMKCSNFVTSIEKEGTMHWKKDARPGVYRLQHLLTGNFYIGSTKNLYGRWKRHQQLLRQGYPDNIKIAQDVQNHGVSGFCFGVIEYCDEEELLSKESSYFESMRPFYNVWKSVYSAKDREYNSEQLNGFKGCHRPIKDKEDFKIKLREAWVKRKSSMTPEELTQKMSKARQGISHSEETKKMFRETRKGKKKSLEMRQKLSESRKGTKLVNGKFTRCSNGL